MTTPGLRYCFGMTTSPTPPTDAETTAKAESGWTVADSAELYGLEAWGQGFATEACNRVLEFAFEKTTLDEVKATTDPGNVASQHVLTKCGLRHQGMRRAYACDCLGFSVTRAEWETQRRVD